MYKHTKIEGPRFQRNNFLLFFISDVVITSEIKKVIYMAHHFKPCRKQTACLSQDPFAHSESLQHPIIVVLLIKILVFFNHSVVFTCSKVNKRSSIQATRCSKTTDLSTYYSYSAEKLHDKGHYKY